MDKRAFGANTRRPLKSPWPGLLRPLRILYCKAAECPVQLSHFLTESNSKRKPNGVSRVCARDYLQVLAWHLAESTSHATWLSYKKPVSTLAHAQAHLGSTDQDIRPHADAKCSSRISPIWPTLPRLQWLLVAESIGLAINQQQRQELVEVQGLRMVHVNCLDEPSSSYRAGRVF